MENMDYPYVEGVSSWPMSSAEGIQYSAAPAPAVLAHSVPSNGQWEEYLQWHPSQGQPPAHHSSTQPPVRYLSNEPPRQPLYNRRGGPMTAQMSLELSSDGMVASAPATAAVPFAFGQPMTHPPSFEFATPTSAISPMDQRTISFPLPSGRSAGSPIDSARGSVASPHSMSTRLPRGSIAGPSANESIHHSPAHDLGRDDMSDYPSSPEGSVLKKRKLDDGEELGRRNSRSQPPKKTAHNMIEKRYRTNLNDKIAALRDSVPSLRVMSRTNGNDEEDDPEDLEGLAPAHKLNKATVLSKATEYIRHLEKRNKRLMDELIVMKQRLDSYEKMSMNSYAYQAGVTSPAAVPRFEDPFRHQQAGPSPSNSAPPQGMIRVPEEMQALRHAGMHQAPYAAPNGSYPAYPSPNSRNPHHGQPMVNGHGHGRGATFMNKMMVGSLAGLMLFEGFVEREQTGQEPEARGLFAIPISLLSQVSHYLFPRTLLFGASPHDALYLLKIFMLIGACAYLIIPLLDFRRKPKSKSVSSVLFSPAPSLAHPVEARRKAWLTAVQTVWVPQHQFILEASAVILKTMKLSTRKLVGWQGYAWLFNVTKEQEESRIKAWDIALDAQLTGGDAEISLSRLVLTLLASGTLPDSPKRLMLKAMHIRVLLWELSKLGYGHYYMFNGISMKLARHYWNKARNSNKMRTHRSKLEEEQLPAHLAALLELDCDVVLMNPIVQRAYNLAWNRPSSTSTRPDESLDNVVEDFAISSPLDALAAWFSSRVINNVLEHALVVNTPAVFMDLETAIATAPPTSAAQVRALTTKAVLSKKDRLELVQAAFDALPTHTELSGTTSTQPLLIQRGPVSAELPTALILAKCLALVEKEDVGSVALVEAHRRAMDTISKHVSDENSFTLLTFVASYRILDHFMANPIVLKDTGPVLEYLATSMRVWMGKDYGRPIVAALRPKIRTKVVERCLDASKRLAGVLMIEEVNCDDESDAGYGSLDELLKA